MGHTVGFKGHMLTQMGHIIIFMHYYNFWEGKPKWEGSRYPNQKINLVPLNILNYMYLLASYQELYVHKPHFLLQI